MNIYEIYFVFTILVLTSTLTWRLPTLAAMARRVRQRGPLGALATCTGPQEHLVTPQMCCLASLVAAQLAESLLSSRTYVLYHSLGYTRAASHALLAMGALSGAVTAPLAGAAADLWGRGSACVACGLTLAAAAATVAVAEHSDTALAAGAVLHGVGSALLRCTYEAWLLGDAAHRRLSGTWLRSAVTLVAAVTCAAGGLAALGGELLVTLSSESSQRPCFVAAAVMGLLSALIACGVGSSSGSSRAPPRPLHLHLATTAALRRLARDHAVPLLTLLHACTYGPLCLAAVLWVPTLQLLDDMLPYGLCTLDFAIAEGCGASLAGLALGLCAYRAASADAEGEPRPPELTTAAAALEAYHPLAGRPSALLFAFAAAAFTVLAQTIYPVFTMSALVALAMVRGFTAVTLCVWRALLLPDTHRATTAAVLRAVPEYVAVYLLLRTPSRPGGTALVTAPDQTQRVFAWCAGLCTVAAVAAIGIGRVMGRRGLPGKRPASSWGSTDNAALL